MSRRILIPLLVLAVVLAGSLATRAQESKPKDPESKYAMDLRVRKANEEAFGPDTKKYGVEVYTEGNTGDAMHISETGSLSVINAKLFKSSAGAVKEPLWQHGLKLKARPAGTKDWEKSKTFGLEVFKDQQNGDLVYITEAGNLATVAASYAAATTLDKGKPKNPTWKHAMDLKVRKAGEKDFTKDTKKVGVEVFRDENNGNLVYISETGSVAVVPGKLAARDDTGKGPAWQHGLELAVRKAGEAKFSADTKKYGIEVFIDENNGNQIYVTETGTISVVPAKFAKATPAGMTKSPDWKAAMELEVRKAGEKDFKNARKFGLELYADVNNDTNVYVTETGELAAVSPKAE